MGSASPQQRIETDSLGAIEVPASHYWGAETQRSIHFFGYGERMPAAIVRAFGQLKAACAEVNAAMGLLAPEQTAAIVAAAEEVASGAPRWRIPLARLADRLRHPRPT